MIRCNIVMCDTLPCVLLSAQYESNSLVTDVLFDVILGLECDVVIGCDGFHCVGWSLLTSPCFCGFPIYAEDYI